MKKVEAAVKPFKLEELESALAAWRIQGMTVAGVNGFARQQRHTEIPEQICHRFLTRDRSQSRIQNRD